MEINAKRYRFILSGKTLSKCPKCSRPMKLIKIPIAIEFSWGQTMFLNNHCRFCKDCDLLIVNKNEVNEPASALHERAVSEKDYDIVGTVEKELWKLGCNGRDNTKDIHPFKEKLEME